MRFRLRTLLIVLALGPVVVAGAWFAYQNLTEPNTKPAISDAELEAILGPVIPPDPIPETVSPVP